MPIIGFDHFIVIVHDLGHAVEAYHRLGFEVSAGGEHPAWGSHNAIVPLSDGSYLELVAFRDESLAAVSFWAAAYRKLAVREGLGGFALASNDIDGDVRDIRSRGIAIEKPTAGARSRPDSQLVAWRTAIAGETAFGILPFLIQDETPRRLRVEPAREGLGSRACVREALVGVHHAASAVVQYRALLDNGPIWTGRRAEGRNMFDFTLPWGRIVLAQPDADDKELADEVQLRGEGLCCLTLGVEDLERELRESSERGLRLESDGDGFLMPLELACGAKIRLSQMLSPKGI